MNWFLLAFISAIFSAASAVLEKKALFSLDALTFSFWVSLITLVFSLPFFGMIQYNDIFSFSLFILFLKTLLSAAAFMYVMLSIKNLQISEALPLLVLTPGLVAISGNLFINDPLTAMEWLGIFLMITGTYILEVKKSPASRGLKRLKAMSQLSHQAGWFSKYSYVYIALILFTISSLLDRVLLKDYQFPPYKFMAFQQLFYVVIFTAALLIRNLTNKIHPKDIINQPIRQAGQFPLIKVKDLTRKTFYLIIIVAAFTVIYRYTQIEATKLVPVALVLSVKRLSTLFAIISGGKLFSEDYLFRRVIAALIILTGVIILLNF